MTNIWICSVVHDDFFQKFFLILFAREDYYQVTNTQVNYYLINCFTFSFWPCTQMGRKFSFFHSNNMNVAWKKADL